MRYRIACFLFLAFIVLPRARAQSSGSDASKPAKPAPSKAHRVWDNDAIQQIQGGISVVGNPDRATPHTDKAVNPQMPLPMKPRGVQYKATTIDGNQITSESLYDQIVLVQLWATWCPHCRKDQGPVDRIARSFGSDGVVVLAVDLDESEKTVTQYLKASPRSCPIILSKDTNLATLFAKRTLPSYIVLRNGVIVGSDHGEIGEKGLLTLLNRAGVKRD
jgi:thiol-disulfide isomerase/thioredoxin